MLLVDGVGLLVWKGNCFHDRLSDYLQNFKLIVISSNYDEKQNEGILAAINL